MENASKALYMVAGVLIGIMIIAFMVYMFTDASKITKSYEQREEDRLIRQFNSQFSTYETSNIDELVHLTLGTKYYKVKDNKEYDASTRFNKISDVITAVNLAHTNNYINSNYYRTHTEYVNSLTIVIDLKKSGVMTNVSNSQERYIVFPDSELEAGKIYGVTKSECTTILNNIESKKDTNVKNICDSLDTSKFLEFFRENRVSQDSDGKNYTSYKYYFAGEAHTSERTGKIDILYFTLVDNY